MGVHIALKLRPLRGVVLADVDLVDWPRATSANHAATPVRA
jgi:hypothetical protein